MIRVLLLFCFSILIFTNGYAQKGCLVSGVLYPNQTGSFFGVPIYSSGGGLPTAAPSCPRASLGLTDGSCIIGFSVYTEYNYSLLTAPIGCPIDDYIPYLLIASCALAFVYIPNNKIYMPQVN